MQKIFTFENLCPEGIFFLMTFSKIFLSTLSTMAERVHLFTTLNSLHATPNPFHATPNSLHATQNLFHATLNTIENGQRYARSDQ